LRPLKATERKKSTLEQYNSHSPVGVNNTTHILPWT
jgi:hypothetical protein